MHHGQDPILVENFVQAGAVAQIAFDENHAVIDDGFAVPIDQIV